MTMAMETILKKIFTDHLFKPLIVNLLSNVLTFWKLRGTLFPKLTSSSISAVENFHLMAIILSNICKIESLSDEPRVCDPRVTFYDVLVQFFTVVFFCEIVTFCKFSPNQKLMGTKCDHD